MEKRNKNKWFIIVGIMVIVSIIGINLYADYTSLEITIEDNIKLIGTVLTFSGVMLTLIFTNASGKQIDEVKTDITSLKFDFKKTKKELSDVVFTITEKDLKDAEKDVIFINGLRDMNEMMAAKKQISDLGKAIHKLSKKIIRKTTMVDEPFNIFMTSVNDAVREHVCTEYEYGLDLIDLEDYERLIKEKVSTISAHTIADKKTMKQVVLEINKNVDKYIENLKGIQDISNGKRRAKFEKDTLSFIENNTCRSIETYHLKKIAV